MDPQQHLEADPPQTERDPAAVAFVASVEHRAGIRGLAGKCGDVRAWPQ